MAKIAETIYQIPWEHPARKYFLRNEEPARISLVEIQARIKFASKRAKEWLETAYGVAEKEEGIEKFEIGLKQARTWQEEAKILQELIV